MRNLGELMRKAEAIDHIESLTMAQRMTLCEAPMQWFGGRERAQIREAFVQFAEQLASPRRVQLPD